MPQLYVFEPVGLDLIPDMYARYAPEPGTVVKKVQPRGCPKNGTMGHCYVVPADGSGNQYGFLVLEASLRRATKADLGGAP